MSVAWEICWDVMAIRQREEAARTRLSAHSIAGDAPLCLDGALTVRGTKRNEVEGNGSARKTLIDVDRPPRMELGSRLEMLLVEDSQAGHAMSWMTGRGRREEEEGGEGGRRRRRRGTRGKGVRHILGETVALIMPTWNQSSGTGKVEFSRAHRRLDHGSNTPDAV